MPAQPGPIFGKWLDDDLEPQAREDKISPASWLRGRMFEYPSGGTLGVTDLTEFTKLFS